MENSVWDMTDDLVFSDLVSALIITRMINQAINKEKPRGVLRELQLPGSIP